MPQAAHRLPHRRRSAHEVDRDPVDSLLASQRGDLPPYQPPPEFKRYRNRLTMDAFAPVRVFVCRGFAVKIDVIARELPGTLFLYRKPITVGYLERGRFGVRRIPCCLRVSFGGAVRVFFARRFASRIATISLACCVVSHAVRLARHVSRSRQNTPGLQLVK